MKFSEYFEDISDLIEEKDTLLREYDKRRDRLRTVREFVNGVDIMGPDTDEEDEAAEERLTNHMLGYRNNSLIFERYYSIYSTSRSVVKVDVDTGDPELDEILSERVTKRVNDTLYRRGRFGNLWRAVSGELPISSMAPLVFEPDQGWLPKMAPNMMFPKGTAYVPDEITYALQPKEFSVAELTKMANAADNENGQIIKGKAIRRLIEHLKEQIAASKVQGRMEHNDVAEIGSSVTDDNAVVEETRKTRINAWWYYEVVHGTGDEAGQSWVNRTLFTEPYATAQAKSDNSNGNMDGSASEILVHEEKAYDSPFAWIQFIVADSELGGTKTIDTAKGIAEISYNSDVDREELLNLLMEGAKDRAQPKYAVGTEGDIDEILGWNPHDSSVVPKGIEEFKTSGSGADLQFAMNLLGQASSANTSGEISNPGRGGETRNQTLERQRNTGMVVSTRLNDCYKQLELLFEQIVERLFSGENPPGGDGYMDIMVFRKKLQADLDEYGVDLVALGSKEDGEFRYLEIKAERVIGDGERANDFETAKWLMDNLSQFSPQVRPVILRKATLTVTRDPDLSEMLVPSSKNQINNQKIVAENEYDTIRRRAVIGEVLPTNVNDIHQDHLVVHAKDMQAHLASHAIQPWTRLDAIQFSGVAEHTMDHLSVLLGNKATLQEGKMFSEQLQEIVAQADGIMSELSEQDQQNDQLSAKEQAEISLKIEEMRLKAQKLGLEFEKHRELVQARKDRRETADRRQYASEVQNAARIQIEKEAREQQAKQTNQGE